MPGAGVNAGSAEAAHPSGGAAVERPGTATVTLPRPDQRAGAGVDRSQNFDMAKNAFIFSLVSRSRADSVRTSVHRTA